MQAAPERSYVEPEPGRVPRSPDRRRAEGPVLFPAPVQEPRLWKAARIAIAVPLLTLSLGALFPFAIVPVSSQAVVNARLSRVRAPMEGNLKHITLETGDVVTADQPLAELIPTAMPVNDAAVKQKISELNARSLEIAGQIIASQRKLARFSSAASGFAGHLADSLQDQLTASVTERDAAQAHVKALEAEVKRDDQAVADHLMPHSMLDQAVEKLDEAKKNEQELAATTQQLTTQIKDVKNGYLLDKNAQAPTSIAQRDEAAAEADQLSQQRVAIEAELAQLKRDASVRTTPVGGTAILRSPVSGPIWSRSASPEQAVGMGDDIYRVADDASIHVEVWLDRRYGPQLSVGDNALVYLSGLGKELTGRVISFQGTSRRRLDEEVNAIDFLPVHPDQYHVTIELAPTDRQSIYIGQNAKVLFPGGKGEFRSKLYSILMRY